MRSDTLAQLFAALGVSRSFSRSHVSDDNAFSEAQLKTLKYQPDYPGRFESPPQAQVYMEEFFGWHNDLHAHSGLALFTPADVFHGRVEAVSVVRQAALDAAYATHPERFPKGPPIVRLPQSEVQINSLTADAIGVSKAAPTSDVRVEPNDAGGAPSDTATTSPNATARTPDGGVQPRGSTPLSHDLVHRRAERHHAARPAALAS